MLDDLNEICGTDEAFLDNISEDLIDGEDDSDIFKICLGYIQSYYEELWNFFVDPDFTDQILSEVDEDIEAEIIDLCKPYIEGFVDLCTKRVDLCILRFPDAEYSRSSRQQVEDYLNQIITFDEELLIQVQESADRSRGEPEPPNLPAQNNVTQATPTRESNDDTTVTKPEDNSDQKDLSKERIGETSNQPAEKEGYEAKRQEKLDRGRIWNHLTISRDQTSASEFTRDFLATLFRIRPKPEDPGNDKVTPGQTPNIPASLQSVHEEAILRQKAIAHEQRLAYQQRILEQQRIRLHLLREDKLSNSMNQPASEVGPGLPNTPKLEIISNSANKEALVSMEGGSTTSELSKLVTAGQGYPNSEQDVTDYALKCDDLRARIASLEQENQALKSTQSSGFRCENLHFIPAENSKPGPNGSPMTGYLDKPNWVHSPKGETVLRSNLPVTDINGFLRQRTDITFVVAYYYTPSFQEAEVAKAVLAKKGLPCPVPTSECITLHDKDMIAAMEEFLATQTNFSDYFPDLNIRGHIPAPYLFWYHYRSSNALDLISPKSRECMEFFTSWIEEHYAQKYALAEDHLARGVISQETMPFLVKPGDVLVWKGMHGDSAAVAKNWLKQSSGPVLRQSSKDKELNWSKEAPPSSTVSTGWSADGWSFEYDGELNQKRTTIEIILGINDEMSIDQLNKYPLKYASPQIQACLKRRGKIFWKCRSQYLVSYNDEGSEHTVRFLYNGERFMVDYKTYKQLHSSSVTVTAKFPKTSKSAGGLERVNSRIMEGDESPPSPDIYVFPHKIPGYNLHTKKWVDLNVDHIREVQWNKESFNHLVVESNTKELIQALVKHQIASEEGTDIVNRKGNGLIILLHGGPGTGKTFTAESVAELAEKPLFRVTCGDIGTKPEEVEKYLDSVLYLGKIWNCIVLIDEAEVFLEQRSLDNLERNALVSVFLRVLEYYEGILILTSNRVGTFDEAFKSRILLSLHYENLSEGQRTQIWKNIFRRLEDISNSTNADDGVATETEPGSRKRKARCATKNNTLGIDFEEVNCYITELARQDLNGRQIRNVITTARQLATFRNTKMRYEHLKHVMSVSSKFDTYLKRLQEGYSDDQIARDEGFR
ncbi:hypothetical protein PG984_005602 [Apiospora sp. TS-2023a]